MEACKIYVENPNILDAEEAGIKLTKKNEVFVEHPKNPTYFISNYGRLWSDRSKKLLTPQLIGTVKRTGQMRWAYKLPDEKKRYKNHRISRLVGEVFCENLYPEGTRVIYHHRDNCETNDHSVNLTALAPGEHGLVHSGKRVFSYNNCDGELSEYKSLQSLAEYFGVKKEKLRRDIKKGKPICTLNDGLINIVELKGIRDSDGRNAYIGYHQSYRDELDKESSDDEFPLLGAFIIGGIAAALVHILKKSMKEKGELI